MLFLAKSAQELHRCSRSRVGKGERLLDPGVQEVDRPIADGFWRWGRRRRDHLAQEDGVRSLSLPGKRQQCRIAGLSELSNRGAQALAFGTGRSRISHGPLL